MPPKPSKKRRPDGRFRVYKDGKYFYSTISYADALKQANAYHRELQAGLRANARNITVRQYASKWLPLHKAHVSDKTYSDYASQLNKLVDELGDYIMQDVTPDMAKGVFVHQLPPKNKAHSDGYSGSTIKRARMLYVKFFATAVENGICLHNPFDTDSAQPIYGYDGTHRAITDEEMQLILETRHWFQPAVLVMLYAGLRRGEAIAVDLDRDVDPACEWLQVYCAIRYDSNQPVLDSPKTENGIRRVPIFSALRPYLQGRRGLLVKSRRSGSLMSLSSLDSAWASYCNAIECRMNGVTQKRWFGLTREDQDRDPGKYARIRTLQRQGRTEEAEKLRLEGWRTFDVRTHDLRHTYCTMLRDAGVDIKQAIEWMGHADEKMILKIYDHPGTKRAADSVKKVENMLGLGQ